MSALMITHGIVYLHAVQNLHALGIHRNAAHIARCSFPAGGAEAVAADRPLGHDERHHLQRPQGTPRSCCCRAPQSRRRNRHYCLVGDTPNAACQPDDGLVHCNVHATAGWTHQRCGRVCGLLQPLQHRRIHGEGQHSPAAVPCMVGIILLLPCKSTHCSGMAIKHSGMDPQNWSAYRHGTVMARP